MSDKLPFVEVLAGAALIVAGVVTSNPYLVAAGAGLLAGGVASFLIPIPQIPGGLGQQSGSQVYNLASAQNQARLQQEKPVLYGQFNVFPDLVSQPWSEYVGNQQILHQLMAVTLGKCDVSEVRIGDAMLASFSDASFEVYKPGETVNLFHTNVATSEQVRDLELSGLPTRVAGPAAFNYAGNTVTSADGSNMFSSFVVGLDIVVTRSRLNNGTYFVGSIAADGTSLTITSAPGRPATFVTENALVPGTFPTLTRSTLTEQLAEISIGPFFAGPKGAKLGSVALDFEAQRGLYQIDASGNTVSTSVSLRVERREEGTDTWVLLANETLTAASLTPQRFTYSYTVPVIAVGHRHELRVTRTTVESNTTTTQNQLRWTGLRGFITAPVQVPGPGKALHFIDGTATFPDLTILGVRIRVSGQIAGGSSRRLNVIAKRQLPVWNGTAWVDQPTSSVVWAFADVIRNTTYGLGKPDSALDLPALLALDAQLSARGDFFNGYFDRGVTVWDAIKSIARCGRCVPLTDGRVFTLLRDEPRGLRTAMFTDRNVVRDSFSMQFSPRKPETPRGFKVAYHDPVSFQVKAVTVGDQDKTTDLTLFGCTDRSQAWREGNFVLNETLYRRLNISFGTEMDGFVPGFGDLISVQSFWADFGQATEIAAVAADNRTLTLATPFDWSRAGPYAVQLRAEDGAPTAALSCTRGSDDSTVVLDVAAPISVYAGSDLERTHIALASGGTGPLDALVRSIAADGETQAKVACVVDDPRVHADPGAAPAE